MLIAQVRDALAQRDAAGAAFDLRAGRLLTAIAALRWAPAREAAAVCGISVRESARLRGLAKRPEQPAQVSSPAPTVDRATTASDER